MVLILCTFLCSKIILSNCLATGGVKIMSLILSIGKETSNKFATSPLG